MKKKILLLWVLLSTAVCTFAYVFESGDLHYNITSDSTVEVTYQKMSSDNYSGLTSVIIPESVTYDGTTYNIMNIGYRAFQKCTSLTSVTIGNGVTIIEINAFSGCTGLTSVTIPNSVTTIRYEAFSDCSGLTSITIPISVTSIKGNAFVGCNSLASIKVESGNAVYDSRNNCNAIIETATNTLVAGCRNTIIPNSVTSIGSEAFAGCTGLTSITIPNSVTNIGSYAFKDCTSLTSIIIPNSVTNIESNAFSGCTSLRSINIPNSVTFIGEYAFGYCTSLTSINIP
ncbi:MAG: leucine-rich repeat domain-containing protein, partial [Paludibacteraceae bacterium]|nr:leucine-rich repeat domain-containing protein [Paludibacteraceae bacterium]